MKTVLIIPAYNAAKMITDVIARIPHGIFDEIIILDDCSRDNTFSVLSEIPDITLLQHSENRGYGGAQITLYEAALNKGAEVIVSMHADGGHLPEEIPLLLSPIFERRVDVVIGSRITGIMESATPVLGSKHIGALFNGSMPPLRFIGHIGLRTIHNLFFGAHYQAWNCGFRAATRKTMSLLNFHEFNNGYLFDPDFLLAVHLAGIKVEEVPVSSFYDSRVESVNEPFSYGVKALWFTLNRGISLKFTGKKDP